MKPVQLSVIVISTIIVIAIIILVILCAFKSNIPTPTPKTNDDSIAKFDIPSVTPNTVYPAEPECYGHADCEIEFSTCVDFVCVPPECTLNTDCEIEFSTCVDGVCVPPPPECVVDTDCEVLFSTCVDENCVPPECTFDNECVGQETCITGSCLAPSVCGTGWVDTGINATYLPITNSVIYNDDLRFKQGSDGMIYALRFADNNDSIRRLYLTRFDQDFVLDTNYGYYEILSSGVSIGTKFWDTLQDTSIVILTTQTWKLRKFTFDGTLITDFVMPVLYNSGIFTSNQILKCKNTIDSFYFYQLTDFFTYHRVLITKYTGNSIDTSYGAIGTANVSVEAGTGAQPRTIRYGVMTEHEDGSVFCGADYRPNPGNDAFGQIRRPAIFKLTPAGILDTSWGVNGFWYMTDFTGYNNGPYDVDIVLTSDGSLMAMAEFWTATNIFTVAIKITPAGITDTTWGVSGFIIPSFPITALPTDSLISHVTNTLRIDRDDGIYYCVHYGDTNLANQTGGYQYISAAGVVDEMVIIPTANIANDIIFNNTATKMGVNYYDHPLIGVRHRIFECN
jgi:hypothetical protein